MQKISWQGFVGLVFLRQESIRGFSNKQRKTGKAKNKNHVEKVLVFLQNAWYNKFTIYFQEGEGKLCFQL